MTKVKVADLKVDERFYPRHERDEEIIEMFAARMAEGVKFDPITITPDNVILDGVHRYEAAKRAEIVELEVNMFTPTQDSNLLLVAASLNSKHGKPLSHDERRKVVMAVLAKDPDADLKELATAVAVSLRTVDRWTENPREDVKEAKKNKVRELREAGSTQEEAAREVGVSQKTIDNWEAEAADSNSGQVSEIAKIDEVNPNILESVRIAAEETNEAFRNHPAESTVNYDALRAIQSDHLTKIIQQCFQAGMFFWPGHPQAKLVWKDGHDEQGIITETALDKAEKTEKLQRRSNLEPGLLPETTSSPSVPPTLPAPKNHLEEIGQQLGLAAVEAVKVEETNPIAGILEALKQGRLATTRSQLEGWLSDGTLACPDGHEGDLVWSCCGKSWKTSFNELNAKPKQASSIMEEGKVDVIITSPPYEKTVTTGGGINRRDREGATPEGMKKIGCSMNGYSDDKDNIGNLESPSADYEKAPTKPTARQEGGST